MEVEAAASEAPAEVQPATAAPLSAEEPRPFKIGTLWNVLEDRQMSFTTQEDTVKTNYCDNWSVQVEDVKTGNLWSLFCQRVARKSLMRKAAATHGNEKRVSWADEKKEREIKYGAVTKEGVQDFLANAYRDTAEVSEAADVHTEEVAGPSCSQPQLFGRCGLTNSQGFSQGSALGFALGKAKWKRSDHGFECGMPPEHDLEGAHHTLQVVCSSSQL